MTAFMNATITRNHSMMKDLIECGVDTHITDNKGENPFHKVAQSGDSDGFAILVKNNSDLVDKINIDGESPLFGAVKNGHLKMVKTLIYHNASLQRSNKDGETIFHRAAQCKNKEMLAEIMNNNLTKANITQQAHNGLPAIHYAAANNNLETMQEFTKHGASYTDCTKNGDTLAHTAAFYGSTDVVRYLKKQMPMILQQRNKDNHTPFIIASKQGNTDVINLIFCEKDIMNGDNKMAINLARQHGHHTLASNLKEAENKRTERRVQLSQEPQKIRDIENNIRKWYAKLSDKNPFYLVSYAFYQPAELHYYSVNDLLDKTEAECEQISLEYTRKFNQALQEQNKLEQEYNKIILAEQAEHLRKEKQRITQQQQAELERQRQILAEQQRQEQAERKRFAAEQEAELKKLNEQNAAIKELNEQNAEIKRIKEQKEELDRIAKEKKAADAQKSAQTQQKGKNDTVAAQKAELDHYAQQKANRDAEKARQQKHTAALEQQQEYVPMNLQPSAPPMEEQVQQCIGCNGKLPQKPSTCKKCKIQCPDICPKCLNKYGGNCLGCYRGKKGEDCYINFDGCTEKEGVSIIPCDNCKINSDRVCKACLDKSIALNLQKNPPQPHRCPYCTQNTLNQTLKQKIFTQN
jgi:ankyrin repeat protein